MGLPTPELLCVSQAAKLLGVNPQTLRQWEIQGRINPHSDTLGGHRRYRKTQILALLRELHPQKAHEHIEKLKKAITEPKTNPENSKKHSKKNRRVNDLDVRIHPPF